MSRHRVLIAGGGVGGLALAQGLQSRGHEVLLFEKFTDGQRAGFRLHMNADGGDALRAVLPEDLYSLYLQTSRVTPKREQLTLLDRRLRSLGRRDHIGPPNPGPFPHTAVNRKTLRQILLTGLEDVVVNNEVVSYEVQDDGVRVHLADGSFAEGDVLVGADGVGSVVRQQLLPHAAVQSTGRWTIYGRTMLTPELSAAMPDEFDDGFIVAIGRRIVLAFGLFEPRMGIHEARDKFWPTASLDDLPPYLMIGGVIPDDVAPGEDEWLEPADIKELFVSLSEDWDPRVRRLVAALDLDGLFMAPMRYTLPVPAWTPSRVTVLGDAIHAMPPTFGAGANLALRDAAVLAREIDAAPDDDLVGAIGRYEEEMRRYDYPILERAISPAESAGGLTPRGFLRLARELGLHGLRAERAESKRVERLNDERRRSILIALGDSPDQA